MIVNVYFIRMGRKGPVKIGTAKNVQKRVETLQTGNPSKLSIIAVLPIEGRGRAELIERWLHGKYKSERIRGEWFNGHIPLDGLFKQIPDSLIQS